MDGLRWTAALAVASVIHVAGLLWFEPAPGDIVQSRQFSDSIVVVLGEGAAEAGRVPMISATPREADAVGSGTSAATVPGDVQQQSVAEIERPTDSPPPSEARPELDLQAETALPADDAEPVPPAGDTASAAVLVPNEPRSNPRPHVAASVATNYDEAAEAKPDSAQLGAPDAQRVQTVISGPVVGATTEPKISEPVPQPDQGADAGVTELFVPAAVVEEAGRVDAPDRSDTDVEVPLQSVAVFSEPENPAAPPPEPTRPVLSTPEPVDEAGVDEAGDVVAAPTAAAILALDAVQSVAVSEQSVVASEAPQAERSDPRPREIARPVTLDELQAELAGQGVAAHYAGRLKGWLQENMHYPRAARLAGQQGKAVVRFVIDRSGRVLSVRLEQESGHSILDKEALEMIRRADPFPVMPAEMAGGQLELRVPVVFQINAESLNKRLAPIDLQ